MDEREIKAAVLERVRQATTSKSRPVIASEFKISSGNTRADLAVLSDEFVGVEIKSEKDSLSRLSKQAFDYRIYFDRTVLVLDGRHLVKYLGIDLKFCDVWTFDENSILRQFSSGSHHRAEDDRLFSLLTLAEREAAFRNPKFSGMSKREIFEETFRTKYRQTSKLFWKTVARRKVRREDINLLSRYAAVRNQAKQLVEQRESEIAKWVGSQSREG